jgi:hypothetical protein
MTIATSTQSAVLFLIFNRLDTTKLVFERIRQARPPRLYVAADGPRAGKVGEAEACRLTRAVVEHVDWPCKVTTLFRDQNLGCKEAVSAAVDWFFSQEEEGIILEDDCLPAPSFFGYCDTLLERYRHDTRVRHICGCNFQYGRKRGEAAYYFSRLTHIWGWASWRRVWRDYDKDLSQHSSDEVGTALANIFDDDIVVDRWREIVEELKANKINTWDYQLSIANFLGDGLCIIPNENLISNIGFGAGATHTTDLGARSAGIPLGDIVTLSHPRHFVPEKQADLFTLHEEFQVEWLIAKKKREANKLRKFRHGIKNWLAEHGGPARWRKAHR